MIMALKRYECKRAIRSEILSRLNDAVVAGGRLEGVETIADGERVRSMPTLPGVFLIRETEEYVQSRIHETIEYELSLLAIVANDDPDVGLDEAEKWCDEAAAVVMTDRNLGLPYVNDVQLVRGIPVSGPHTERRRVAAVSVIKVTFTIIPA